MATLPGQSREREIVSHAMRQVRSAGTGPERLLRAALRKAGIRTRRTNDSSLPGKPDLVMPAKKLAIFVDGDYWHGHQHVTRGFSSLEEQFNGVSNASYWTEKISSNVDRDFRNTSALIDMGWKVLRFWGSEVEDQLSACVKLVDAALTRTRFHRSAAFSELPRRTVIELFAGIGLVHLGLRKSDWRIVYANDNDQKKFEMYAQNFSDDCWDDRSIKEVAPSDLPDAALITASFPCNDLSLAGARNGLNGRHSGMFWQVVRLLKGMKNRKPPLVVLENVLGFLTSDGGRDFEAAIEALNALGYSCDAVVLDAAAFVPQSRVRLFVIASQIQAQSTERLATSTARPKQLCDFIKSHAELKWAVRLLPNLPKSSLKVADILEQLPDDDPLWWSEERAQYFFRQLSERHAQLATAMISGDEVTYATAFRRVRNGRSMAELRFDGIAGCLRTPRGGSGRQILFRAGRGRFAVRLLTGRECARLQGILEDSEFKVDVPLNQALFGFGDAVCVPVIEWLAQNYLGPLASEMMRNRVLLP